MSINKNDALPKIALDMKTLANQIERKLKASEWGHCAIYEDELQRLWPPNEKDRNAKIAQFARDYGFHLAFYRLRLCAIFEKEPKREASQSIAK